jgi:hypothetical protein
MEVTNNKTILNNNQLMPILLSITMQEQQQRRSLDFRFLAEPTDVNFGGKVHGRVVMKWMDQAGYACAAHRSAHYFVTVPSWQPQTKQGLPKNNMPFRLKSLQKVLIRNCWLL